MNLHIKSKVFSMHNKMEVLDENDEVVYTVSSKAVSIHNKTCIKDRDGNEVANISRKVISIHEKHEIEMANGTNFELSTEIFHITKDVINVEELGWTLEGDFFHHNYQVLNSDGTQIATTHVKWMSMHNILYIDISDDSQADTLVALFVTLEHIIEDRNNNAGYSTSNTQTPSN